MGFVWEVWRDRFVVDEGREGTRLNGERLLQVMGDSFPSIMHD